MLSRTGEYALRAVVYMAQGQHGVLVPGSVVAAETKVPPKYLAKILGDLVRAGVLESTRGLGGGFRFARPPNHVKLYDVLAPFENFVEGRRRCPFNYQKCSDRHPCHGHESWKQVRDTFEQFLRQTSVMQVAFERNGKPA